MRLTLTVAVVLLCLVAVGHAQDVFEEGKTITFELQNGDKLTGILEKADGPKLIVLHDILGRIELDRADVKIPAPKSEVAPIVPWSGKFDASLSGSEGNADNQTFRVGLDVKHEEEKSVDNFTTWFRRAATDDRATEEKFFAQFRHDWKLENSKWRPFWQASYEQDQFAGWDARAAAAVGAGYQFIDSKEHKLAGRLGFGANNKYGVDDPDVEELTWEALLALDWLWQISEISSLSVVQEFYPGINPSGQFRSVTRISYDMRVGPDSPWYWRLGYDSFYDSKPGDGFETRDWNYYAGIGRAF
jgi:hypothetical protein